MTMAAAPPPPLHILAIPFSPGFKLCTRWPTILAPDIPMGCPSDTAPPWTFTKPGSIPRILMFARTTTLKASLISHMEISSFFSPHRESTFGTAAAGATGKSIGSTAASPNPTRSWEGRILVYCIQSLKIKWLQVGQCTEQKWTLYRNGESLSRIQLGHKTVCIQCTFPIAVRREVFTRAYFPFCIWFDLQKYNCDISTHTHSDVTYPCENHENEIQKFVFLNKIAIFSSVNVPSYNIWHVNFRNINICAKNGVSDIHIFQLIVHSVCR